MRWNLLTRNPAAQADPPRGRAPEAACWAPEQVSAFLAAVEGYRLACLWRLADTTGLRRGEVLGLRWRDVNLDKAQLHVRQALIAHDGTVTFSEPKTAAGRRTISLDPSTVSALRHHRKLQAEERLAAGPAWTDTGLVFTTGAGEAIHPATITKVFDRLRKAAGLPAMSLHGLRHGHATALLQVGAPIRVVSQRLGHASVAVTQSVYGHALPGDDESAALVAAKLLGQKVTWAAC